MRKLQGKVAIVTGASKGIGAGIAKGLGAAITGKGGQALTDAFRDEASGTHVGTIGVTC